MAGHACLQEAGWKDFSFLGNRAVRKPCRHGVPVLESHGLYAGGPAGHSPPAAKFQVRIPGKTLSEQKVGPVRVIDETLLFTPHYSAKEDAAISCSVVSLNAPGDCSRQRPSS